MSSTSFFYTRSLLLWVPLAIVFLRLWVEDTFGQFTLEQLIFHTSFGVGGLLTGDMMLAVDFLREVILLPLAYVMIGVAVIMLMAGSWAPALLRAALSGILFVFFIAGIVRLIYRTAPTHATANEPLMSKLFDYLLYQPCLFTLEASALLVGVVFVSRSMHFPSSMAVLISWILSLRLWPVWLIASIVYVLNYFPLNAYLAVASTETDATYIDHNYVAPVIDAPQVPLSLVLIYVESLEASYRGIPGEDILELLDEETNDWQSLDGYTQVFGTGWTTAGLVATQCGLPLRPPIGAFAGAVNDDLSTHVAILGQAKCLSDVLATAGYQNVFMKGASLSFGGLDEFIWPHAYVKAWGREEWIADGETQISEWGLTDDRLFARAKQELDRLLATRAPFNFSLLTTDNHGPNGILNNACAAAGVSDFPEIVRCNAALVADFIAFVRKRAPNAVIVVMGDHLAHENPLLHALQALPQRHVYGKVLPAGGEVVWRREVSHFDFFPSILELLGFTLPTRRAGLGTSFVGSPVVGFVNPLSTSFYNAELAANSKLYMEMWKPR